MNAYISKLSLVVWSVSSARAFLYSLIVTGEAFNAATKVTGWSAMTHDQHLSLCIGLFIVQAGVMLAFLDQTIAKLSANPISTAETAAPPLDKEAFKAAILKMIQPAAPDPSAPASAIKPSPVDGFPEKINQ